MNGPEKVTMHLSGSKTHARKEGAGLAPRVRTVGIATMLPVDLTWTFGKAAEHF